MNWLILEDMIWLALLAVLCWYIACGIFAGVRFLADSFRSDAIVDYSLFGFGDNTPRGFSESEGVSHD